eukprot:CAMPEP_0184311570 /NCGR_PEP_ID=MMETSP1049-20130417/42656_1 /TAXON_ID=77928 /ORGANISM="Proteomonas sulcata, Strain CCMP704" /LENGTH=111 /DNA_ID=CAMNT_0026627067 /DNA_START=287 /DNA_END=623 /DNA_ORIENTATION=-
MPPEAPQASWDLPIFLAFKMTSAVLVFASPCSDMAFLKSLNSFSVTGAAPLATSGAAEGAEKSLTLARTSCCSSSSSAGAALPALIRKLKLKLKLALLVLLLVLLVELVEL